MVCAKARSGGITQQHPSASKDNNLQHSHACLRLKNDLTSGLNVAPSLPNINNNSDPTPVVKITEGAPDACMFHGMLSVAGQA